MKNIKILKRSLESIPKTHINRTVFEYYVDNTIVDSTLANTALIEVLNQTLVPDEENEDLKGDWRQSTPNLVDGSQFGWTTEVYTGIKYIFKPSGTALSLPGVPAYLDPLINFSQGTFYEALNPITNRREYYPTSNLSLITIGYKAGMEPNPYRPLSEFGVSRAAIQPVYFEGDNYYQIQNDEIATHGFDADSQTYKPINFWGVSDSISSGDLVWVSILTEKKTDFSISTSDVNLKLSFNGEIDSALKPSDLTAKILMIAEKFSERPDKPSKTNV